MIPMLRRVKAIAFKEFLHIVYDLRTLAIIIFLPVIMLLLFGYALNMELKDVKLGIVDYARNTDSRKLVSELSSSDFFIPGYYENAPSPGILADSLFKRDLAHAVLAIPQDYPDSDEPVQLIIDAVDPNFAKNIEIYANAALGMSGSKNTPFEMRTAIYFNPDMKSAFFFVPALIALILIMISCLLTSIAIVREKETGTMEQILVSPVRPFEVIAGKIIPYGILSFVDAILIVALGIGWFGVSFVGSVALLATLTLLYIALSLSLGFLISTMANSQQVALMMALSITLLPTFMLSGFVFPIASMPEILQWFTAVVPAKYYLQIARGIMLKGSGIAELWTEIAVLSAMTVVLFVLAVKRFRTDLEE